jgi:hypothetical protein
MMFECRFGKFDKDRLGKALGKFKLGFAFWVRSGKVRIGISRSD